MDKRLEVKGYKIPKITMDFEKVANGKQRIHTTTTINIVIPKNETDKNCVVVVNADFKNEKKEVVLSVVIRGHVEILDKVLSNEEKEKLIKREAVPEIYEVLREFIDNLLDKAQISFMNLLPYEEFNI